MKRPIKKTMPGSFFITFCNGSRVEKDLMHSNPKYKNDEVEVLQMQYFKSNHFIAEVIEKNKFNNETT